MLMDRGAAQNHLKWSEVARHAALLVLRQEDAQRLVRFFDQKAGVYSVHGASALFIARQYYKTTAVIKYYGSPETGLPGLCWQSANPVAQSRDQGSRTMAAISILRQLFITASSHRLA